MQMLKMRHGTSQTGIGLILLLTLLIEGCSEESSSESPAPNIEWVTVTSISSSSDTTTLNGTAWVSQSYYASNCVGFGCLLDSTRTGDYPGVDVTYANLTTGASGKAASYYGPGTNWIHEWSASVPVIAGNNTIRISAFDPSGKGGSTTVDVVAPLAPLGLQSTSPVAGAAKVPVSAAISATFNYLIDTQSVTPSAFTVTGPSGALAGTVSVTDATVKFLPNDYLAYDATYTATLTTAIKGVNGQALTSDYSWNFTAGFTSGEYQGVWGSSGRDVFVVGFGPILHYDGKGLVDMTVWDNANHRSLSPPFHTLYSIWGSSGSDVFAVGDYGTILHYDGSSWTAMSSGTSSNLFDVWGSSGSDIFAVGSTGGATPTGILLHYDGSSWTVMAPAPAGGLYSVWGSSGSDVFAAGYDTILHYDGVTWTAMNPVTSNVALGGLWGSSGSDVYAVGDHATILHYDGNTWTAMPPAPTYYMHDVWGDSASNVFAVGEFSTLLHYDGNTWTAMTPPTVNHQLYSVWGSSGSDVFAVGSFGSVIFHYKGSSWTTLP